MSYHYLFIYLFITKHPFHSTKLVQDEISKIRNLLSYVPNVIKFVGVGDYNQQHEKLKLLSVAIFYT